MVFGHQRLVIVAAFVFHQAPQDSPASVSKYTPSARTLRVRCAADSNLKRPVSGARKTSLGGRGHEAIQRWMVCAASVGDGRGSRDVRDERVCAETDRI